MSFEQIRQGGLTPINVPGIGKNSIIVLVILGISLFLLTRKKKKGITITS